MKLKELWEKGGIDIYSTDKESTHQYLGTYDKLFAPLKNRKIGLVELGYGYGGSCKLWQDYFLKARIRFIEKLETYLPKEFSERVDFIVKNIHDVKPEDFKDFPIDIAIDDGDHWVTDQVAFIKLIYPLLRKGGLLIIEDVHDLEENKKYFDLLQIPFEVFDLRYLNTNPVNVLLIFRK